MLIMTNVKYNLPIHMALTWGKPEVSLITQIPYSTLHKHAKLKPVHGCVLPQKWHKVVPP